MRQEGFNNALNDMKIHRISQPLANVYEKLEKQPLQPSWDRPRILSVRHSFSNSEALRLWSHVIVVNVEYHMLAQF